MKGKLFLLLIGVFVFAFTGCTEPQEDDGGLSASQERQLEQGKGIGVIKHVSLRETIESDRVSRGFAIYEMRCQSCHSMDTTTVVGPGWAGIVKRRQPEWIMNMMLNVDGMIEADSTAAALLGDHHTRMPDPNISIGDARDVLEFMRSLELQQKEE